MAEHNNGFQPGEMNNEDNYNRQNSLEDNKPNDNYYNNDQNYNNENMEGLGANDEFGYDNGFDEVVESGNAGLYEDAGGEGGGGLGAMMGLDEGMGGNDDLTQMEMDMMNDGGQKISIRMFIDIDEDDDNSLKIQINDLFKRADPKLQFYVDVSTFLII